jgi:hypothetical protein
MGWSSKVRLSISGKTLYSDYNKTTKILQIQGVSRDKKWFKNDPNLSIFRQKSAPKFKMRKFVLEMTIVDCVGSSQVLLRCKRNLSYLWLLMKI